MIGRRTLLGMAAALPFAANAQVPLRLHAGAPGGTFLPYGRALAEFLDRAGAGPIVPLETAGSNANLVAVDSNPDALGLAFLPAMIEAARGDGFAAGRPLANIRALFATHRATYQFAARRDGPRRLLDLDGKRVGVGPAGGPDAALFNLLARDLFVTAIPHSGTTNQLVDALAEGEIDAMWVGALLPVPAIAMAAEDLDAQPFGLSAWEIARVVDRNPALSPAVIPARTYRGQEAPLATVGAWNFAVAHKDLPDERAYAIVRAALGTRDPARDIHAFAAETRAANAGNNRVVPYHPGALRHYREAGVALR
jgi:uncharacterized protein